MTITAVNQPRVHVVVQSRDDLKTVYAGSIDGIPFRYVIDADGDSLICGRSLSADEESAIVNAVASLP